MDEIKTTGKTVDDALTEALIQLGTTSDQVDYEVIDKGSKGILGFGAKPAVILVKRKKKEEPEFVNTSFEEELKKEKEEISSALKKESTEAAKKPAANTVKASDNREKQVKKENTSAKTAKKQNNTASSTVKTDKKAENETTSSMASADVKNVKSDKHGAANHTASANKHNSTNHTASANRQASANNNHSVQKNDAEDKKAETANKEENEAAPAANRQEKKPLTPLDGEKTKGKIDIFLSEVFKTMNMEVEIKYQIDEANRSVYVDLSGDEMGILIGKRGQTLDSLQYLISLVANKDENEYIRVKLDTENYRRRRRATLENLARNIAYKVKRERKSVTLEPMNPYERRIIHTTLQNDRYVETHSEGTEPYRRVVVSLKKNY